MRLCSASKKVPRYDWRRRINLWAHQVFSESTLRPQSVNGFEAPFRNGTGARERPQSRGSNRSGHQEVAGALRHRITWWS